MTDTQSSKAKTKTKTPKKAVSKNDRVSDHAETTPVNDSNYYQLDRILSENADYNLIIGERGNGKTFAVQKYIIQHYLKTGGQFFLLRRWVEDVKPTNAQNFIDGNLISQLPELTDGRFSSIVYRTGRYILVDFDEKGKPIIDDNNTIGYVWDVSESERLKGNSFPNVDNIVFEEFISLSTMGYIPDEITLFLNIISTIVRDRTNVKIWLLGNTVNPYNPYFNHFGINGFELNQGDIATKYDNETGCKVAIEFCAKRRKGSLLGTSAKYFAFGVNDGSSDMIIEGKWQIPNYPVAKFKPKNSRYKFFIKFDEKLLECHIMVDSGEFYLFVREINPKTNIGHYNIVLDLIPNVKPYYYTSLMNIPSNKIPPILPEIINNNKIWFDKRLTGAYFYNYMSQSVNNRKSGMSLIR